MKLISRIIVLLAFFSLSQAFGQTNPNPHVLSTSDFTFAHYSYHNTLFAFPGSMIGWVGSAANLSPDAPTTLQATGNGSLCATCPRNASQFYRGQYSGVSLQNNHLGDGTAGPMAICLALNTEKCHGIELAYLAVVDSTNTTVGGSSLQLQYRIGTSGDWINIVGEKITAVPNVGENIDWRTGYELRTRHSSITLPAETDNQPVVQLRWLLFSASPLPNSDAFGISMITAMPASIDGQTNTYCRVGGLPRTTQHIWSDIIYGAAYQTAYIKHITVNDTVINKTSTFGLQHGYSDYTAISGRVKTEQQYTAVVSTDGYYTNPLGATIWIDWNQDNDFDDPDESTSGVYSDVVGLQYTGDYAISLNFLVPPTAKSGPTRMRVRLGYPEQANQAEPCGPTTDGEVEDYTLIVENPLSPAPVCINNTPIEPTNNHTAVCTNQDKLSFPPTTDADGYLISLQEKVTGIYVFRDSSISSTTIKLGALKPNTQYKWWVITYNSTGKSYGCDTFFFKTVAELSPLVAITPTGDTLSACQTDNFQLDNAVSFGLPPYNYQWTGSDNQYLSSSTASDPAFNSPTTGFYRLKLLVSDQHNCQTQDSVVIQVKGKPAAGSLTTAITTLCAPDSVQIKLTGNTGTLNWEQRKNNLSWNSTQLSPAGSNYYYTHLVDDIYAYRAITTLNGCSDTSNTVQLAFYGKPDAPFIEASVGPVICQGTENFLFTSSYTDGLHWTNNVVNDSILVQTTGNYFCVYEDEYGCYSDSAYFSVTVNPVPAKPVVILTGNNPACDNNLPLLSISSSDEVYWNDASTTVNDTLQINVSGVFVGTVTNSFGCSINADPLMVQVKPAPAKPTITIVDEKTSYCFNETILIASNISDSISWSTGETTDTISNSSDTLITAIVTSYNGCTAISEMLLLPRMAPVIQPVISYTGSLTRCAGDSIVLTSSYPSGNTWNTNATTQEIVVQTSDDYYVSYTDNDGCSNVSDLLTINFETVPVTPTITQLGHKLFANTNADHYQWYDVLGAIAGATDSVFEPTQDGDYYVIAYSANDCPSVPASNYHYSTTGISSVSVQSISVYPNPNNGQFKIAVPERGMWCRVYDGLGKLVINEWIENKGIKEIMIPASGIYQLKLSSSQHIYSTTIVVR